MCTAHRAKGSEWPYVIIAADNWNIQNEDEINLLYVACTRAKYKLDYSEISSLLEFIKDVVEERSGEKAEVGEALKKGDKNERNNIFTKLNKLIGIKL